MEFKCKSCGALLYVTENASVVECEYCGLRQTLPRSESAQLLTLFDRADYYRSNYDFSRAAAMYDTILTHTPTDPEANWGACLCRYGISYVKDPRTKRCVPTCHRTQFASILSDENYMTAIANADEAAKAVYQSDAKYIDDAQKQILAISTKEAPFDVFICYKDSDANGARTEDSVLAQDIYTNLTGRGYKVFFSRITLEDKLGSAYEPYIFAALNSAKVMLVVATQKAHLNEVWVKNEWSRYLDMMQRDKSKSMVLCYKDISPVDLPDSLALLESQDLSVLGWMQDLTRGVEKLIGKTTAKSANVAAMAAAVEQGDWANAKQLTAAALSENPENGYAHYYAYLAHWQIRSMDELTYNSKYQPGSDTMFRLVQRFGNGSMVQQCELLLTRWKNEERYNAGSIAMDAANYAEAAQIFTELGDFRDSAQLAAKAQALPQLDAEIGDPVTFYSRKLQQLHPSEYAKFRSLGKSTQDVRFKQHGALEYVSLAIMILAMIIGPMDWSRNFYVGVWGIGLGLRFGTGFKRVLYVLGLFLGCAYVGDILGNPAALYMILAITVLLALSICSDYAKRSTSRKNRAAHQKLNETIIKPAIASIQNDLVARYEKAIPDVRSRVLKIPTNSVDSSV